VHVKTIYTHTSHNLVRPWDHVSGFKQPHECCCYTGALFDPEAPIVLKKRSSYSGNLNSKTPRDSKIAFLNWEDVVWLEQPVHYIGSEPCQAPFKQKGCMLYQLASPGMSVSPNSMSRPKILLLRVSNATRHLFLKLICLKVSYPLHRKNAPEPCISPNLGSCITALSLPTYARSPL